MCDDLILKYEVIAMRRTYDALGWHTYFLNLQSEHKWYNLERFQFWLFFCNLPSDAKYTDFLRHCIADEWNMRSIVSNCLGLWICNLLRFAHCIIDSTCHLQARVKTIQNHTNFHFLTYHDLPGTSGYHQNGTCATVAGTTPVAAAALATIPDITTAGIAGRHGKVEAQRCFTYLFIFVFFGFFWCFVAWDSLLSNSNQQKLVQVI